MKHMGIHDTDAAENSDENWSVIQWTEWPIGLDVSPCFRLPHITDGGITRI